MTAYWMLCYVVVREIKKTPTSTVCFCVLLIEALHRSDMSQQIIKMHIHNALKRKANAYLCVLINSSFFFDWHSTHCGWRLTASVEIIDYRFHTSFRVCNTLMSPKEIQNHMMINCMIASPSYQAEGSVLLIHFTCNCLEAEGIAFNVCWWF